jgi:hypothetical protein
MSRIAQPHIQALLEGHTPEEVIQQVMAHHAEKQRGDQALKELGKIAPQFSPEAIKTLQATLLDGSGSVHVEEAARRAVAALKAGDSAAFFVELCTIFRSVLKALPHVNPRNPFDEHALHGLAIELGFVDVPNHTRPKGVIIMQRDAETLTLYSDCYDLVGKSGVLHGTTADELTTHAAKK